MLADASLVLRVGVGPSGPSSLPPPRATFPALPSMIQQQLSASDLNKRKPEKLDKKFEVVVEISFTFPPRKTFGCDKECRCFH
jgi:hypothetical protein